MEGDEGTWDKLALSVEEEVLVSDGSVCGEPVGDG